MIAQACVKATLTTRKAFHPPQSTPTERPDTPKRRACFVSGGWLWPLPAPHNNRRRLQGRDDQAADHSWDLAQPRVQEEGAPPPRLIMICLSDGC